MLHLQRLLSIMALIGSTTQAGENHIASASSSQTDYVAAGATDDHHFSNERTHAWKGTAGQSDWWWQVEFPKPRDVGAILQIHGDHAFVFRNGPKQYVWQRSLDGKNWHDISETRTRDETRTFRIHRLEKRQRAKYLRLQMDTAVGGFPTLRGVQFFEKTNVKISFPEWIVVVNTTHDPKLPGAGQEFISLAKSCKGFESLEAQQIWVGDFKEAFLAAEPRPLCAFLSGNFKDWCEVDRETWRGTQEILRGRNLPMWASCGGAQGLAILAEAGVDKSWDCPHCRDPRNPKLPIYTHIGHTDKRPCGDYSACISERGPYSILQVRSDPAFAGLSKEFRIIESHCGQIEWPPKGWDLIATAGDGTKTQTQCLRMKDRYIYAAQFHIEMAGEQENARRIMGNFLALAKQWGGYNPRGKANATSKSW